MNKYITKHHSSIHKIRTFLIFALPLLTLNPIFAKKSIFPVYVKSFGPEPSIQGNGSLKNPYQIAHPFHLEWMRKNLLHHFELTQNLDLEKKNNFKPIGNDQSPFQGNFDGKGKIIKNLKIHSSSNANDFPHNNGLFGKTGKKSVIRNVRLEKIDVKIVKIKNKNLSKNNQKTLILGGLTGINSGTIESSSVTGKIKTENDTYLSWLIGGLVGKNEGTIKSSYINGQFEEQGGNVGGLVGSNSGTIKSSYAIAKIKKKSRILGEPDGGNGGLVAFNYGTIQNSYAAGQVEADKNVNHLGGLVGNNYEGIIKASYAINKVKGGNDVGGLVGIHYGIIVNSYATGQVKGERNVGGLVGWNDGGMIENSYATGQVEGHENIGGLVGENREHGINTQYFKEGETTNAKIKMSYVTGQVEGKKNVGGIVGLNVGIIEKSYSIGKVKGKENIGRLVGNNEGILKFSYTTEGKKGYENFDSLVGKNSKIGIIQ